MEQTTHKSLIGRVAIGIVLALCLFGLGYAAASLRSPATQPPETLTSTDVPKGAVLVFERATCSDCQATLSDIDTILTAALPDNVGVYHVDTTTDTGKKLVDQYSIPEVPSVVFVPANDDSQAYQATAYTTDKAGNSVVDMNVMRNVVAKARADAKD